MSTSGHANTLLCISYRFPPETYPLAMRVKYFLQYLHEDWHVEAVTAAEDPALNDRVNVHQVAPPRSPQSVLEFLRSVGLGRLVDLTVWPDPFIFWILPALLKSREIIEQQQPDAIAVFMMPYSQGLIGVLLKQMTGLPLILNFNDSLTCSDMNPTFPSPLHFYMAQKLEDFYIQQSDAAIYVSRRNMNRVKRRQPAEHRDKFFLIRRAATRAPSPSATPNDDQFRIVYTGGTSGWYAFLRENGKPSILKRAKHTAEHVGRHWLVELDYQTHGPIYLGRAVKQVIKNHPEWADRIKIDVFGGRYPEDVEQAVLEKYGLQDIITLHESIPHEEALQQMVESDLLFMALPNRGDGSPGGRISAKTYEYLMTDRPILAALPPGENREYLEDKNGVHLTEPDDVEAMADVVDELTARKFDGQAIHTDRSDLQPSLEPSNRAENFESILRRVTANRDLNLKPVME